MVENITHTMQKAVEVHKSGNFQEAERLYKRILQTQPMHAGANHNLGAIAVSLNKIRAALPLLKNAVESAPRNETFWTSYVQILIKEREFRTVKKILKECQKSGLSKELLVELNKKLALAIKNPAPASTELEKLFEYYHNEKYDDAEKLALTITNKFPKHKTSWKILSGLFQRTNRIAQSTEATQKVIDIDPSDPEAHNNLSVTLERLSFFEEALKSAKQAITLKPNYAEAYYSLGNSLRELGRLEEAVESYKKAVSLNPNYHEAYNNLGFSLELLNKQIEAEESFNKALEISPNYGHALLNRGQFLLDKGDFEAALKDFDSCNTLDSRARALTCLYRLGKIKEVYKRIENSSEEDRESRRIAAFASFLAVKEKKETAHNFCKNPLEFLHFSNISSHVKDYNAFTEKIIEELLKVSTVWEPSANTTKKGFQSKINLFEDPTGKILDLKNIVLEELSKYYSKFKNEPCILMQKWPTESSLRSWYVILKQQGHQSAHIHPSGWLSGVIYLKVVPSLGKDEGAIEFGFNGATYSDVSLPVKVHQPKLGDIVFFPSSLHHRTIPFTTDTDRIIVSFDLIPRLMPREKIY